jgi:hypothetical protein
MNPNKFRDEYDRFLRNADKFRAKVKIGKMRILKKQIKNNKVIFTLTVEMRGAIKMGKIVLIQTPSEGWRIVHDSLFLNI